MGVRLEGRARESQSQNGGPVIRARRGVVSNASVWDTQALLPAQGTPPGWRREALATLRTGSFMHLHLGERSAGIVASPNRPPVQLLIGTLISRWQLC